MVDNLARLLRLQADRLGPRIALRFKSNGIYRDLPWREYLELAGACAAALVEAGVEPGDRVGLLSENRLEWLIADMGILAAAAVNVPAHAPLTAKQAAYQFHDAGARWLFVSNQAQWDKIRQIRGELPELRGVVSFDRLTQADQVTSWEAFLQRGRLAVRGHARELARREDNLKEDDLATIMYTSGTTGNPKGVMLTHGNLLSNARATNEACPREDAILLNWLPFSHIYARTVDHYLTIVAGATLCLAESAETLIANLAEIQPTHLSSVPRFYEKALTAVAGPDAETSRRRLRAIFGPRIDWLNSGGAPLPLAVAEAYRDAGLFLLQGYGLTESSPVISFNKKHAHKLASVGQPLPGVEVKITQDGEIATRGPLVMKGYWNNPRASAEAIRDGWLYTGDLGTQDEDGFLFITGRKKELLVLSSGKKIVPNHIEGLLLADPCIDQAVVYGESRSFLSALVVPHWTNLRRALGDLDASLSNQSLSQDRRVHQFLEARIGAALADVSPPERVKKFLILPEPFSVANDELTVSLKLRRSVIFAHHQEALDALYRST